MTALANTQQCPSVPVQFLWCDTRPKTITCSVAAAPGQKPWQVASKFINAASTCLLNRKAHERRDQVCGFIAVIFEAFTNDAATIKTFGGYTTAYELTNNAPLNGSTFRGAYFMWNALNVGSSLGLAPKDVRIFNKRERGGAGTLEEYL